MQGSLGCNGRLSVCHCSLFRCVRVRVWCCVGGASVLRTRILATVGWVLAVVVFVVGRCGWVL